MKSKLQQIKLQKKIKLLHELLNQMDGTEVCYNDMVDHKNKLISQL